MTDPSPTSHDVVLAAMPLSLVVGLVVSFALSLPAIHGVVGGCVPASGVLGYALFVDPPSG